MMRSRVRSEAAQRFSARRQREEEAERLHASVPKLATLRFDISEGRGSTQSDPKHSRIIPVAYAPALFVFTCADPSCKEGGHDLTHAILRGLQSQSGTFDLEDRCYGSIGSAECGRVMHVHVTATYQ